VQHFGERASEALGDARLATVVYGYRPPALRTESGKPDLRFFVEMTAEDRAPSRVEDTALTDDARTVFIGPTFLLLHKTDGEPGRRRTRGIVCRRSTSRASAKILRVKKEESCA